MTHHRHDEDERPRESYPNPTQQRIDDERRPDVPADVSWDEERWGERPEDARDEVAEAATEWPETSDAPHEGERGQEDAV